MIYKNLFPGGRTKALTLSYDDGVRHDLRLMDILRASGIKATFNINGCRIPEEIKTRYQDFEIAIHGYSHPFLEQMPRDMMALEIARDRHVLEKAVGYPVRGMAYPYGTYNASVMEQLRAMGVVYSRTVHATRAFDMPEDFLAWHPTCHHDDPALDELCGRFLNEDNRRGLRLFYVWGHTYEFENNQNWEVIERFCERMAGREDIWYATNIEIYDYVQALERLVTSCDGELLFNPSAIDVWVTKDGKPLCVPAGKVIEG